MEDLSNKPISYTGNHPLERDYRALRARLAIAEAERDEYKLQRDKWIADEPVIEAERDDLRDANGILSEALEAARQTLEALTARVVELEAALDAEFSATTLGYETVRVANIMRAKGQWRPVAAEEEGD